MISIRRTAKPAILVNKEQAWQKALLQAKTKAEKEKALARYNHKEIRDALESLFQGKCAYCESQIKHVSFSHIEHYRPTSKRPDLAFHWENLLLACGRCNQEPYKADNFPEVTEGGPIINPCDDDPDAHFSFHYEPRAQIASVYGITQRGITSESVLGLNRPALRKHRSSSVKVLMYLKVRAASDPVASQLLLEAAQDNAEYAAFARALLKADLSESGGDHS